MNTKPNFFQRNKKRLYIGSIISVVLFLLLGVFVVLPVWGTYQETRAFVSHAKQLNTAFKDADFDQVREGLAQVDGSLGNLNQKLQQFAYIKYIPWLNRYYFDADSLGQAGLIFTDSLQTFLDSIKPYASILGFRVNGTQGGGDIGLKQFLTASPQIMPALSELVSDVAPALPYLTSVHAESYPNLDNYPIRDYLMAMRDNINVYQDNREDIMILLEQLPKLAGAIDPQYYLVLFQNDKELRPTGGFITSYATLEVDAGQIKISEAKNIYEISTDEAFLTPPAPIVAYLKQPVWRMRDVNFSPDYRNSMETFNYYWQTKGLPAIDGIISIDTQFVEAMLSLIGPVEVADYSLDFSGFYNIPSECTSGGTSFTAENVVCRLEAYAQRITLDQTIRKAVIGELMGNIFERIMSLPKEQWYPLYQEVIRQFQQKHILAYSPDGEIQELIEKFDMGGRIKEYSDDYLLINDANLAGLKSDMYLKRSVVQEYKYDEEGRIVKSVKITYENTGAFDGWLNATARNYVRVYVPLGSELISVNGGSVTTTEYEDSAKQVFDNFIQVAPLQKSEIEFVYRLPESLKQGFDLLIQKQPGVEVVYHDINVNGSKARSFELRTDTIVGISLEK